MQSYSGNDARQVDDYLDNIRRLIDYETNVYNEHVKGSVSERFKDYFNILKSPTLNLSREYEPYKKILDDKKLSNQEKLDALIEKAREINISREESREKVQKGKIDIGGKWNYGGQLHFAIANINKKTPYEEEKDLHIINLTLEEIVKKAPVKQKSSPARLAGVNDNSQPTASRSAPARLSSSPSTMYNKSARGKETNEDKCVKLLLQIFTLALEKGDMPEKEKNEYYRCNYLEILKDPRFASGKKIELLFAAAKPAISGSLKGELHQLVTDINPSKAYIARLSDIRDQLKQSVSQRHGHG